MESLKFKLLGTCSAGPCPTIYEGSDGNIYIKGYIVSQDIRAELETDGNEDVVQIPRDVMMNVLKDANGPD